MCNLFCNACCAIHNMANSINTERKVKRFMGIEIMVGKNIGIDPCEPIPNIM